MIFFYYGDGSFRAKQKIQAITEKFQEKVDPSGHSIEKLDGENMSIDDFFNATRAMGFLSSKKLIIIKNIFDNKKLLDWQDDIIKYLKTLKDSPDENYIIFWQTSKPDSRKKIFKALSKFKYVEEFPELKPAQLNTWIKQRVSTHNKTISAQALSLLISSVGNNLWQLEQEINKLVNFVEKDIDEQAVKDLVKAKIDDNIFNLVDAIGNKNKALALKLIDTQIKSGINAQYILSMIVRQYRLIIKAKSLGQQIKYTGALAQALKISPYAAEKASSQSRLYEIEQLKKIYAQLLKLDKKFKTTAGKEQILFAKMINEL